MTKKENKTHDENLEKLLTLLSRFRILNVQLVQQAFPHWQPDFPALAKAGTIHFWPAPTTTGAMQHLLALARGGAVILAAKRGCEAEFSFFATSAFIPMLAEGRKYGLGMTLAQQSLASLPPWLQADILTNSGSLVCFRVGAAVAAMAARPTIAGTAIAGLAVARTLATAVLAAGAVHAASPRFGLAGLLAGSALPD